jgi:hypothetical protein
MTILRTTAPSRGKAGAIEAPDPYAKALPPDLTPDLDPNYDPRGVPPDPYAIALAVREATEEMKKENR